MPKLAYGTIDGKGVSYSRLLTAHACPRKFQLENIFNLGTVTNHPDFAFGHAVGAGVQCLVNSPTDLNLALVACASAWDIGIYEEYSNGKKSLWYAIRAIEKFHSMLANPETSMLKDLEIATFKNDAGKVVPAIELTFKIICQDGYIYEGHIDLILYDRKSDTYLILELKTTKFNNISPSMYKNSAQALGYSVVLDSIATDLGAKSAYSVLYLVYKSSKMEYEPMIFPKTRVQRAHFINALIIDIEKLRMYAANNIYPQHGESCFDFFKDCEFIDTCGYNDETLIQLSKNINKEDKYDKILEYDFVYKLEDIRENQIKQINESLIASDSGG